MNMTNVYPPHGENEQFYYLGRADFERDTYRPTRPVNWTAKQWFAYQDGLQDAHSDACPDITALMNEQYADQF
jgi:hypothetical protein